GRQGDWPERTWPGWTPVAAASGSHAYRVPGRAHEALTNSKGRSHGTVERIAHMTADVRHPGNDGRESDDWLGTGDVDWGEPPPGTRPARASTPGEPLWDLPSEG